MAASNANAGLFAALKGFVLAVVAAGAIASLILSAFWVIGGADGAELSDFTVAGFLSQLAFFGGFAAGALIVVFAPFTLVLAKFHAERAWSYPLLGFSIGFALALLIPGPREQFVDPFFYLTTALAGGLPGVIGGWVWWVSYRRSRTRSLAGGFV